MWPSCQICIYDLSILTLLLEWVINKKCDQNHAYIYLTWMDKCIMKIADKILEIRKFVEIVNISINIYGSYDLKKH